MDEDQNQIEELPALDAPDPAAMGEDVLPDYDDSEVV